MNALALALPVCAPVNDVSAPSTLALGTTLETALWRAHRYAGHIEVTELTNAGKRGKTCARFSLMACTTQNAAARITANFPSCP